LLLGFSANRRRPLNWVFGHRGRTGVWGFITRLFARRPERSDVPRPDILARAIRRCRYSPAATRSAELMSGGFMWSDEMPARWYFDPDYGYTFRFLIGFRASLIRGEPMEGLRPIWDEVRRLCPQWPGFRPERSDPALREELERELRSTCRSVTRALRQTFGRPRKRPAHAPEAE
jgi:hypothetical protein